jgi:hypothetical protein
MIASPTLLVLGLIVLLVGFAMLHWASSRNLKDVAMGAAFGAAWTLLWRRRRPAIPEEITSRVEEIRGQDTHLGKARVVTGYAVTHVIAQIAGIAGMIAMLLGVLLAGLGVFWR